MSIFMLDTCICSFIMREMPLNVLRRFNDEVSRKNRIVISAITYAEMRYGQIGKKASPKHRNLVDGFILRIDEIMPWNKKAIDFTIEVKSKLAEAGKIIGNNDTAIVGHALAENCILVTNNMREFKRVTGLVVQDWMQF